MTCMETDGIPKEVLQNAYETCAKIWEEENNTLEEGLEKTLQWFKSENFNENNIKK